MVNSDSSRRAGQPAGRKPAGSRPPSLRRISHVGHAAGFRQAQLGRLKPAHPIRPPAPPDGVAGDPAALSHSVTNSRAFEALGPAVMPAITEA